MNPGSKVDTCLILEGKEGIRKSSSLKELVPDPKWFTDSVGDFQHKDTLIALRGKWIVEMGELTALSRNDVELAKAFITRTTDTFRGPYGRVAQDWPRQFVLSGTSNHTDYLVEAGGNRRFWPVQVRGAEEGRLASIRDQLWAEARYRWQSGEKWWLHEAELIEQAATETASRVVDHPWEDIIGPKAERFAFNEEITVAYVLKEWLEKDPSLQTQADGQRIGRILRKSGFTAARARGGEGQHRRYWKPR